MPVEQIWPKGQYSANDTSHAQTIREGQWYREVGSRTHGEGTSRIISFNDSPKFGDDIVGLGANESDSGATETWVGKTQTWTAAKVVFKYETFSSGNAWNDGTYDLDIYNHNTQVDTVGVLTNVGDSSQTTIEFTLDVSDWGTSFVDITKAQLRFIPRDGGTDPAANAAIIKWYDCYIEGTYSGGSVTLNSQEIPFTQTDHSGNWATISQGLHTGGWPFGLGSGDRIALCSGNGIDLDPEVDLPVINVASGWTDHTNGETLTQAFFVLEHKVQGEDNDDWQWDLVEGSTPTQVEVLYTSPAGNGDYTETSGNITTPADWDTHSIRCRYIGSAGMGDTIIPLVNRVWCDAEFPGVSGTIHQVACSPQAEVDSAAFMAGEILIGGNPSWYGQSEAAIELSTGTVHEVTARSKVRLDSVAYLHGVFEITASAKAQLNSTVGSTIKAATLPDNVVVTYVLHLEPASGVEPDILLPVVGARATARNGKVSRAAYKIPDADMHLPLIESRLDGTLNLWAKLVWPSGLVQNVPNIVIININDIETTQERGVSVVEVSGSKQRTFGAGFNWAIQTEGDTREAVLGGVNEITTLHDPRVVPGDFLDIVGVPQAEITEIGIELSEGRRTMTLRRA